MPPRAKRSRPILYQTVKGQPHPLATADLSGELEDLYGSGYEEMISEIMSLRGLDETPAMKVPTAAADYANERGGELITNIDETTRGEVADMVARAQEDGLSDTELADQLNDSFLFGDVRAQLIARTEGQTAWNMGTLRALRDAGEDYVVVNDPDECGEEICDVDGEVWTLDEAEAEPLGHPNCGRDFRPLTEDELAEVQAEEAAGDEGDIEDAIAAAAKGGQKFEAAWETEPRDELGKWTDAGGSEGKREQSALEKHLIDYKPGDRALTGPDSAKITDIVPGTHTTNYLDVPGVDEMHEKMGLTPTLDTNPRDYVDHRDLVFEKAPREMVNVQGLTFTQPRVNVPRLDQIIEKPYQFEMPVQVLRVDGKDYLMNGHHRVAAAYRSGRKEVPAHVLTVHALGGKRHVMSTMGGAMLAALLAIDPDELDPRQLFYSEDQPRDEAGRWTATGAAEFVAARSASGHLGFLSPLNPADLGEHKLFTAYGGKVGFAVDPQGDIQNVFNNGGPKGAGVDALAEAITAHGGRTLDCFDGFLPGLYAQMGFVETGRMIFSDEHAPPGWDFDKHGRPDVVFMAWRGFPRGKEAAIEQAKDHTRWDSVTRGFWDRDGNFKLGSSRYYADFERAKEDSRRAVGDRRGKAFGLRPERDGRPDPRAGAAHRLALERFFSEDQPRDDNGRFTFVGGAEHLGGTTKKSIYADASGKQHLFKPDNEKKMLAAEAASKIGRIADPNAIHAEVVTIGGQRGLMQQLVPGAQPLDRDLSKLSKDDIQKLQREHVVDWATSQHDSHPGQFIRDAEGNLIGTDKSQAWKHLDEDKLSHTYHPNAAFGERPPIYNSVFRPDSPALAHMDPEAIRSTLENLKGITHEQVAQILGPYAKATGKGEEFIRRAYERIKATPQHFADYYTRLLGRHVKFYSEDQPRAEDGKWTSGGSDWGTSSMTPAMGGRPAQVTWNYPDWAMKSDGEHVYRGVTSAEYESIVAKGEIQSTGAHSLTGEGTQFGPEAATALSYVSVGRDNPAVTGKPVYVVEVKRTPAMKDKPDGYVEAHGPTSKDSITRVWRFNPDGSIHVRSSAQKFYSEDEPRDDHGRWTDSGGGLLEPSFDYKASLIGEGRVALERPGLPTKEFPSFEAADKFIADEKKAWLDGAVQRLGYDPANVEVRGESGPPFKVGDREFIEGGHFEPSTGKIVLWGDSARSPSLVAHEVEHAKWQEITVKRYREEYDKVVNDPRSHVFDDGRKSGGGIMRADGRLWPEFEKDYPVYVGVQEAYLGSWHNAIDELSKTDGVSDYSRAYWDVVAQDKRTLWRERAINETLAEIAAATRGGALVKASASPGASKQERAAYNRERKGWYKTADGQLIAPAWGKLYNTINALYAKGRKK